MYQILMTFNYRLFFLSFLFIFINLTEGVHSPPRLNFHQNFVRILHFNSDLFSFLTHFSPFIKLIFWTITILFLSKKMNYHIINMIKNILIGNYNSVYNFIN